MRDRVAKLRVWLLGSAVFLMLVIGAFIGTARYLRKHLLSGIPVQMALNILRETTNFTYCPTDKGRTKFCVHAARSMEYKDGKMTLHEVSITLYGKSGDRSDHIYGDEFEYDRNSQVGRATGVVHMDMQAAGSNAKVMHVTTSGLVYVEKLGVAATSEAIEFEAGEMTGHAVGADYSSDSGILLLHSAVTMSGTTGGHALAMTAASAEFDDRSQQARLTRATYESEGRRAAADEATLDRRPDGTLSRIQARGNVTMEAKGANVAAERADIALSATSQPQKAVLTGAVKYVSDEALKQVHGQADSATFAFDAQAKPQPEHAVFAGAVHMTARTRATAAAAAWSTRDLTAARVETSLVSSRGISQVRDVKATGSPRLSVVDNGTAANGAGGSTTELAADDLSAHLVDTGDAKRPSRVDTIVGRGHTLLRQTTADGTEQRIAADTLDAKLKPTGAASAAGGKSLAESLWSSVQQGHVAMMRRLPVKVAKAGAASAAGPTNAGGEVQHALADRAVYDGDLDRMTLSGGVQVTDAGSMLWADQFALDHRTGDAHATGGVKVSDSGEGSPGSTRADAPPAEPTHVLADREDVVHATGIATFYGRPVRLWQGGNQIQAAVIELSKTDKRLVARGDGTSRAAKSAQVVTVLAGSGDKGGVGRNSNAGKVAAGTPACVDIAAGKAANGGAAVDASSAGVTRIVSGGLTYSGTTGEVDFTEGLRAETVDGTIRGSQGTAYLRQANASSAETARAAKMVAAPTLSGELDRVVITGSVELDKPGLKATGRRLVYTSSDRSAVLTGDEKNPPKAVEAQGTTTGAALRFRSSCDGRSGGSVEVLSTVGGATGQRVHTDARIEERRRNEKGK